MIELRFGGWFQCRLATDPDPYDEPRGVTGYVHAYVGEPDLDRRITFQPPSFMRSHAPNVGIAIDQVTRDDQLVTNHPLLNSAVNLLGSPKFEGRNGVIADDGLEPVYPFELEVTKQQFRLIRAIQPENPDYPYPELFAAGVEPAPDEIRDATGIPSLIPIWRERRTKLLAALPTASEADQAALHERIAFIEQQLANNGGAARFFFARMRYEYSLGSPLTLHDPNNWLPEAANPQPRAWPVRFWFGGWDADVLCGYARGTLTIDLPDPSLAVSGRQARITDRRP
jgi:hypothetical protein